MAQRVSMWLWLYLTFLVFALLTKAEHGETTATSVLRPTSAEDDGLSSDWSYRDGEGNSKTQEALSYLHSIKQVGGWMSNFDKKSGIIAATAYYAKKGFVLLFMNGPPQDNSVPGTIRPKLSKPLAKAVDLLEAAALDQDPEALFVLAELNFHGNYSHPRDYKRAFDLYLALASLTGNSTAQHMVGFIYATGIGNAVEQDQAKALMYHTFAAKAGDIRSQMTVAFRHHSGIGTPRNCHEAVVYYKKVADKAIQYSRSGPPGGLPLLRESYHIADDDGGVYGDGASFSSSGHNAPRGGPGSDQHSAFDDVMEYLDVLSRKGDLKATFGLGSIHYDGSRTVKRNFKTSRKYFMQIARQYWNRDDRVISDDTLVTGKYAAKAAAYLGRFYLRGEGVTQNFEKAIRWFKLGVGLGDAFCQYEMGLMYLYGLGVKKEIVMASNYFKESAQNDWPAAQVNLGKLFLDQGDLKTASMYFELALRHGHIEAFYHLAEINNFGIGRERSCDLASSYYKIVSEKVEALHSSFNEANQAYEEGDLPSALVKYMMAAEQGYEQAQANVAYILDEHKSILSLNKILPWKRPVASILRNAALALVYWTRSAKQFNIDSTVKMGDYYLNGHGVEADVEKAAQCYQSAAEMQQSAQALWNLGWMHENGLGVEQDFHLAYRLYEEAAEANSESRLPVRLSILKLRVRSYWNQLTDGKVNPIQPEPEEPNRHRTWSEWLANFLADFDDGNAHYYLHDPDNLHRDPGAHGDERVTDGTNTGGVSEDFYLDEIDASILETVTMLALAAALALLVYYRQARQQQNHARARQRQGQQALQAEMEAENNNAYVPGQQADGGFFPPPGDPNFDAWRAGGVGH